MTLLGVDGCRGGWLVADGGGGLALYGHFAEIPGGEATRMAVDMPIGLPDRIGPGGRGPEPVGGGPQAGVAGEESVAIVDPLEPDDVADGERKCPGGEPCEEQLKVAPRREPGHMVTGGHGFGRDGQGLRGRSCHG